LKSILEVGEADAGVKVRCSLVLGGECCSNSAALSLYDIVSRLDG